MSWVCDCSSGRPMLINGEYGFDTPVEAIDSATKDFNESVRTNFKIINTYMKCIESNRKMIKTLAQLKLDTLTQEVEHNAALAKLDASLGARR